MIKQLRISQFLRLMVVIAFTLMTFSNGWLVAPVAAACVISGSVYRDYNNNGQRDVREPGQAGITLTAYNAADQIVGTLITPANGSYAIPLAAVPDGEQVRVELTTIPTYLRSGRVGSQSPTTVGFLTCTGPVANFDWGLFNPAEYCHSDTPDLATSCYVPGDQRIGPDQNATTFVKFPFGAQGDDPHTNLAVARQTGSTFGLAYQRSSGNFFVGSFLKRHAGFGPNAAGNAVTTGAIYQINETTGATQVFLDLNTLPAPYQTGPSPHPTSNISCGPTAMGDCWQYDTASYNLVGKSSLGSIKISEDDRTLYVMNLTTRELLEIPIGSPPVAPPAAAIRRYPLNLGTLPGLADPNTGCPASAVAAGNGTNFADVWPFAVGVHDGQVYAGVVCTAESTQNPADLRAYVYRLNVGGGFTQVFTLPLNYPRRCADLAPNCPADRSARWRPWTPIWPPDVQLRATLTYPEPWLTDLVFDGNDMILGLRDRMGDRMGNRRPGPFNLNSNYLVNGIAAGDILRACGNGAGGWTLEANGQCGALPATGGAGNNQGPGGGEFYFHDTNNPNGNPRHDEITLGGLAIVPGSPTVAVTAFDPLCETCGFASPLFDNGVIWLSNTTGTRTQSYRLLDGVFGGNHDFGKTDGLGDLESICGPPPLEIGNRVWIDTNQNGVQDPGETPIAGVILQLYIDTNGDGIADRLVGRTTTDGQGTYYFNENNLFFNGILGGPVPNVNFNDINGDGIRQPIEPAGLLPNTAYEIRLDDPSNYAGGPLFGYQIAPPLTNPLGDVNGTIRDSNGINTIPAQVVSATNYPITRLVTGEYGDNDHTYDFGFFPVLVTPTPSSTLVVSQGSVIVSKVADRPFAQAGDTVIWTITVTNPNSIPVSNVTVQDKVPPELDIVSASATMGNVSINGQTVTLTIPQLNAGQSAVLRIITRVRLGVPGPVIISNTVSGNPGNSTAEATVIRAGRLPNTGESPLSGLQTPLLLLVAALVVGLVAWRLRQRGI
jgi:uncharacterized repeat protein (TIGR01451 family)